MRAVVQRVEKASVRIDGCVRATIGKGIVVFLGVEKDDTHRDAEYLLDKITNLRIFEDAAGKMNHSVLEVSGEALVVSQFTLLGDTTKGRRPSFVRAEEPARAKLLYEYFLKKMTENVGRVAAGEFQAMMKVELINDGPVTLLLDTRKHLQDAC